MSRDWLFTWRTYGTWLPGQGGFVGFHHAGGGRVTANAPGGPLADAAPALARYAAGVMTADPVTLDAAQAAVVLTQLTETARHRGRRLDAAAVLATHVHIVFGADEDADPDRMLADWKAYASRALNRTGRRAVWWARDGSTRALASPAAWAGAVRYVRDQAGPLAVRLSDAALAHIGPALGSEPRA